MPVKRITLPLLHPLFSCHPFLSILSGVHKARRTLAQERGVGVRQTGQGGSWLKFNHNILGLYCFE